MAEYGQFPLTVSPADTELLQGVNNAIVRSQEYFLPSIAARYTCSKGLSFSTLKKDQKAVSPADSQEMAILFRLRAPLNSDPQFSNIMEVVGFARNASGSLPESGSS